MLTNPYTFLIILLIIAMVAKNTSLLIAAAVLILLKVVNLEESVFPVLKSKGITIGVTIITIAVLVPIATGEIGVKQLGEAMKSSAAWVALASGIIVALLGKVGVNLLATDPHITAALVIGTILAVALFNGVAVGPLIGAGIAYTFMKIMELFTK